MRGWSRECDPPVARMSSLALSSGLFWSSKRMRLWSDDRARTRPVQGSRLVAQEGPFRRDCRCGEAYRVHGPTSSLKPTWRCCCHGENAPGMESSLFRRSSNPSMERCCEQGGLPAGPPLVTDPGPADADAVGMARGVGTERCGDSSSDSLKNAGDAGLRGAGAANVPRSAPSCATSSCTRPAAMTAETQSLSDGRAMGLLSGMRPVSIDDGALRFSVWTLMAACVMEHAVRSNVERRGVCRPGLTCRTATMRGCTAQSSGERTIAG